MNKTICEDIKAYYDFQDRIIPYFVVAIVIVAIPLSIYSYFNLFTLHSQKVKVFCSAEKERIGVTSTREITNLKLYFNEPEKFVQFSESQKKAFLNAKVELDQCEEGYLFSGYTKGVKKVKFIDSITNRTLTVYLLEDYIN